MDNIGEIVFAVIFLLFAVFAAVRRNIEGRDIERRSLDKDWSADDLPEETRRMLYGDPAVPTARPAKPQRDPDPFVQVREVLKELGRQFEPQTAKPRHGAPRPQAPVSPPPVPRAPKPLHPMQPQFKPPQQPQRPVQAPRPAPRPQPPRMVPQVEQGAMRRVPQAQQQRPAPAARRQQPRPAVALREPDEGPTMPIPRAPHKKDRAPAPRRTGRWLSGPGDLRRGIVLAEILGPPRAMREFEV